MRGCLVSGRLVRWLKEKKGITKSQKPKTEYCGVGLSGGGGA